MRIDIHYLEDEAHAAEAARAVNDLYADLVQRYPTRFAAFAATPWPLARR